MQYSKEGKYFSLFFPDESEHGEKVMTTKFVRILKVEDEKERIV